MNIYIKNQYKNNALYSFVNSKVKILRYQGKNPSCNTTDFLNRRFKKGFDEGIRNKILMMVKKEFDQTFQSF